MKNQLQTVADKHACPMFYSSASLKVLFPALEEKLPIKEFKKKKPLKVSWNHHTSFSCSPRAT